MEKYPDCTGIVFTVSFFANLLFFVKEKAQTASGMCFCGGKVVSLSLFDLF